MTKFRRLNATPDDNCRVYYRHEGGALYCWQEEFRDRWAFYRCSRDGEPSHQVTLQDQPAAPGKHNR